MTSHRNSCMNNAPSPKWNLFLEIPSLTQEREAQQTTLHVPLFFYLDSRKTYQSGKIWSWSRKNGDCFYLKTVVLSQQTLLNMPYGFPSYTSYRIKEKGLYFPITIFKVSLDIRRSLVPAWAVWQLPSSKSVENPSTITPFCSSLPREMTCWISLLFLSHFYLHFLDY